ncbi:MAG: citrate synthase [Bdellovibrionales bacterium]|nr:citrate synthase [Bdellovibrionales bacterium]NQZ20159.1 citrate synthase [Bdellovibrionales bacterium]
MQVYDGAVDRGLEGVIACTTAISSIVDATLCYRGYTIEDLAENSSFEEVVFLLWNDRLPTQAELTDFQTSLRKEMALESELVKVLKELPTKVHPMAWLRTAVSTMGLWDADANDMEEAANHRKAVRLSAKMATLVAAFERIRNGQDVVQPKADKSVAWNFLYMLKGEEPTTEMVKVFDTCLILHADHELNCSAFASRVTASSLSDMHSAIVSAIGALKGPLHGGANEQVMRTLKEIGSEDKVMPWLEEALAEKKKIMGFGHRVYKNGDPRAKILRSMSKTMTEESSEPQWYAMSQVIDDEMKSRKGLLPNVDFYSASVYYSMGIPLDIYTPIFAVSRVTGWIAHILEQYSKNRIYRPRGQWDGKEGQKYSELGSR